MSAETLRPGAPAWLHHFCAHAGARQEIDRPWTVDTPHGRYTVATSGHRMIAIAGDLGYPSLGEHASMEKRSYLGIAATITALLSAPGRIDRFATIDLDQLRNFLTSHVKVTAGCSECHCEGVTDCDYVHHVVCCDTNQERACQACGDDGRKLTKVQIGLGQFNARLFARPLEAIAGEYAYWHQAGPEEPATLSGKGWRLVVSPMKPGLGAPLAAFPMGGR